MNKDLILAIIVVSFLVLFGASFGYIAGSFVDKAVVCIEQDS